MLIASDDLISLPVLTKSGQHLGKIDSFDVDIDTGQVINYYVKTGLIKELWHQKLVISYRQVVSITKEKMVVEDGTYSEKEKTTEAPFILGATSPSGN